MYKRTEEAIRRNLPTRGGVMVNCQMGKAIYDDIAFTIPTRIDASGAYYVIEEITTEMNEDIKTEVVGYLNDGKWANMHEQSRRVYSEDGIEPTIHTCGGGNLEPKIMLRNARIRKLTERECFRLQGVDDKDIDKIQSAGISKTQQYKMAGNSIVVDVLYHIFRKMFVETKADAGTQLELF